MLAALVCCQFASGVGFVVPARSAKDGSRPFPCMSRPCGCLTYDECWAGDCCCFTLAEKLGWAESKRITPPAHAVRAAARTGRVSERASCCRPAARTSDECPECSPGTAAKTCPHAAPVPAEPGVTVRWVLGISAQRCKGHPLAGWWAAGPAVPPELPLMWAFEWVPAGAVPFADAVADILPSQPADPPPKA